MNNELQKHPILFKISFALQFIFWKIVVLVGKIFRLRLSTRFLNNSITRGRDYIPKNLTIQSKKDIQIIEKDSNFREKVNFILNKYAADSNELNVNANTVKSEDSHDIVLNFENHDLFLALHGTIISIKGTKNENELFDLIVTIDDTYDFTKIRQQNEMGRDILHILGNFLNNIAVISSKFGVLKTFKINATFDLKDYNLKD